MEIGRAYWALLELALIALIMVGAVLIPWLEWRRRGWEAQRCRTMVFVAALLLLVGVVSRIV